MTASGKFAECICELIPLFLGHAAYAPRIVRVYMVNMDRSSTSGRYTVWTAGGKANWRYLLIWCIAILESGGWCMAIGCVGSPALVRF